ncbi:5-oxoprolinase subunit B family protein [Cellulomonas soli]|uniref:Carboxyltransferase domain-containing protein n=1 Tax=Cellulomonas soli TaxID=931535 RepID=A0A512PGC8_9CELL|nr:allophanate hydrolase subunit 1 [Cellulomonas soli]NYI58123.1 KipI family sensor histidine kinase inhibitor [Cellulomonas soli]GEP70257.1 hypothetical protein CSO01_29720 [Cellulomonas soli]
MTGTRPVVRPYGDEALLVDLPDLAAVRLLDAALTAAIAGARAVASADGHADGHADGPADASVRAVLDVVPAARTVLLRTRPGVDLTALAARVLQVWDGIDRGADIEAVTGPRLVELPVRYDGADLREVADLVDLSVEEVVARHLAPEYTVAFGGFMPGFAYLTGLDPRLRVPRLATPRERVPAGAVAVADEFSAVYPAASPGGWRLLGRCPTVLFDVDREPPALLPPGSRVRFVAVDDRVEGAAP